MQAEELEQYQKLTKFQKDVVDALINLGFKHKYFQPMNYLVGAILKLINSVAGLMF